MGHRGMVVSEMLFPSRDIGNGLGGQEEELLLRQRRDKCGSKAFP